MAQEEVGARLSRNVWRGPATEIEFASARAGNNVAGWAICRGRSAVSERDSLACKRRANHPSLASEAPSVLQFAAVHIKRHSCRHGARWFFAQCALVRSGSMRHTDYQ